MPTQSNGNFIEYANLTISLPKELGILSKGIFDIMLIQGNRHLYYDMKFGFKETFCPVKNSSMDICCTDTKHIPLKSWMSLLGTIRLWFFILSTQSDFREDFVRLSMLFLPPKAEEFQWAAITMVTQPLLSKHCHPLFPFLL